MFGHEYREQNGDAHSLLKAAMAAMFGYLIFVILRVYIPLYWIDALANYSKSPN
jgi:hypothetical protein